MILAHPYVRSSLQIRWTAVVGVSVPFALLPSCAALRSNFLIIRAPAVQQQRARGGRSGGVDL